MASAQSGGVFYLDGKEARRRAVRLVFQTDGIGIIEDGAQVAFWRYVDLRHADAPKGTMRLYALGAPELARLEVRDANLEEQIATRCPDLKTRRHGSEIATLRIVAWSLAAAVSLVLTVVYLVPAFADRLAPFIPISIEQRLGDAVDRQVLTVFGEACASDAGTPALQKLGRRLTANADLPMPASIAVLPSEVPNAVALPGGRVYIFEALLNLAESPDEVAGVVAHELGHVAGRDGLRRLLQTSGSAFLLGLLFGDVTGGGAIIFGAQTMVDSSYSRETEAAADGFAAELMLAEGRSPAALGALLGRLGGGSRALAFISSHPVTADRVAALDAADRPANGAPFLTDAEWQALKTICGTTADREAKES